MSITVMVSVNLIREGEYRVSFPLAPSTSPGAQPSEESHAQDKVLPLGSSTLSPGLRLPLVL